jgi:hypothetical protein
MKSSHGSMADEFMYTRMLISLDDSKEEVVYGKKKSLRTKKQLREQRMESARDQNTAK